jgi:hypothetical protein
MKILVLIFAAYTMCYSATVKSLINIDSALERGFNITSISGELINNGFTTNQSFILTDSSAFLEIINVPDGDYIFTVKIFSDTFKLAETSTFVKVNDVSFYFPGELSFACSRMILKIKSRPDEIFNINLALNFEIDSTNLTFKTYPIEGVENLADQYYADNLPYIIQMNIRWDLLDSNMVPITHYPFGSFRNPVDIALNALALFQHYYQNGDSLYKQWFLNNINWLMDNHTEDYFYEYPFAITHGTQLMDSGWVSAMGQAEALKVIIRAFFLTGDSIYLNKANHLFHRLYKNTAQHWIFYLDDADYYWLEEYPNPDFCHVMGGKMSSLLGLWDFYVITRNHFALKLFEGGLKTIVDHIPLWNIEGQDATRYCKHFSYSLGNYNLIHKVFTNNIGVRYNIPELIQASQCFSQDNGVQLILPSDNSVIINQTVEFKWHFMNHTEYYLFQLSEDSTFSTFVFTDTIAVDTTVTIDFLSNGKKYFWRIKAVKEHPHSIWSETWSFTTSASLNIDDNFISYNFYLYENYPNPFNPITKIKYSIKRESNVTLKIYNLLGENVKTLVNEVLKAGIYEILFDGSSLASGVYIYKLTSDNSVDVKKMVLIK